jgi:hypothetical protein
VLFLLGNELKLISFSDSFLMLCKGECRVKKRLGKEWREVLEEVLRRAG